MELGITLRNMGPQSSRELLLACARGAEESGLDAIWVTDHIAIPPDDAEGSGGRYLDPLATLSFLAGATSRIGLGTGVLILPYRPALPTAKWVATLQELSGGRLRLGVGVGWMGAEFQALGVPRSRRGADSDAVLELLQRAFGAADDVVEEQGQRFLFRPNPARPPIFVGGAAPHALERAVRYADGWMPMGGDLDSLREPIETLRRRAQEAGRPAPEVVLMNLLPLDDPPQARERLAAFGELGVTRFVQGARYDDAAGFLRVAEGLAALR